MFNQNTKKGVNVTQKVFVDFLLECMKKKTKRTQRHIHRVPTEPGNREKAGNSKINTPGREKTLILT